jgi:D-alanyl-D-alanine carboxypeptidase
VQGIFVGRQSVRVLMVGALAVVLGGCGVPSAGSAVVQPPLISQPTSVPPAAITNSPIPAASTAAPLPTVEPTLEAPTAIATLAATATPVTPKEIDLALAVELQHALDQLVADGKIPGAALALHIPGQVPWTGASGFANQDRSQPMEPTTQIRIASISKVFTAVVVLQMMEEGKLDLDTPIAAWFPQLVPDADTTTVHNLLNHTSGLYDYLEDKQFLAQAFAAPDYDWAPEELVAYAAQHRSAFRPGTKGAWDYSSTNYVILGMVIEEVTGHSLAHEMRERIFIPLGLEHTFFAPDDEVRGMVARGYRHRNDQTNLSLSFAFATANMVSTVSDVQRFGDALFGGRLLRPETLEMMFTFENGKGQYNMPALEYGLGVMRNQLPVGPDAAGRARPMGASMVMGHTGGFGGFRTALWYAPESGITIALGMNQGATDPNILATRVFEAVLESQGC